MRMDLLTVVLTTKIINNSLAKETEKKKRMCLVMERTSSFCSLITLRHDILCLSSTTKSKAAPDMPGDRSIGTWHSLRKLESLEFGYHIISHFQDYHFGLKCLILHLAYYRLTYLSWLDFCSWHCHYLFSAVGFLCNSKVRRPHQKSNSVTCEEFFLWIALWVVETLFFQLS